MLSALLPTESEVFLLDVVVPVQYDPGVQQSAVYIESEQHIFYGYSCQFLADLFDLNLSPGTLQHIVAGTANRMRLIVDQIKATLMADDILPCNEICFYIGSQQHWLRVTVTKRMTCCYPHRRWGSRATGAIGCPSQLFMSLAKPCDFWPAYRQ